MGLLTEWNLSVGVHGVRTVTFTCPSCRTVTMWEVSNGATAEMLKARCCKSAQAYPASSEKFMNFIKGRRQADSDCGGVSYLGRRR